MTLARKRALSSVARVPYRFWSEARANQIDSYGASFLLGLLTFGRAIKAWCLTGPSSTHPSGTLHYQDRLQDQELHVINRTSLWKASHDSRRNFVFAILNYRKKSVSFLLFKSTGGKQLPVILNRRCLQKNQQFKR